MITKTVLATVYTTLLLGLFTFSGNALATQLNWIGHWKGEYGRQVLVEEVKKEFEFLNPGIDVNLVYDVDIEGPGDYFKQREAYVIAEMIRTGDIKWDVIFLGVTVYNYVAEILGDPDWGKKHLLDYSSIPSFRESHKEFILNTPYYREQTGGIFVGPFIEGLITCLWYNKKVASRLGLEIQEEGMTVEQFLGYAEQVSRYNATAEEKVPFFSFSSYNRVEVLFEYLFKSHFNDPQTVIELNYTEEKAKAFLDTLFLFEELSKYQPVLNENWRERPVFPWMKEYLEGNEGLFAIGGTYWYGHFRGQAPDAYTNGIPIEAPIVKYPNGLVGQYSNVWAVMKDSPNRDLAVKLLQLWSEPKIAENWIEYTKNPTGLKGHLGSVGKHADIYSGFVKNMSAKYDDMPMRYFRTPLYLFGKDCKITQQAFREDLSLILEGRKSARGYFDEVMDMHGR